MSNLLLARVNVRLENERELTLINAMFLGMQEGFAAPEDADEQAHLDQDEY